MLLKIKKEEREPILKSAYICVKEKSYNICTETSDLKDTTGALKQKKKKEN